MLDFARAVILPHFDSLMSITGAGGAGASAFYAAADECIEKVLRSIAGYARMNVAALRIESGVWDTKTRAQMLLARLHAKICSADQHSLISRVVRMSMAALSAEEYTAPATKWSFSNHVHKQSWSQQALAAADGLNMPKESVRKMVPGSLLNIQEERLVDGAQTWDDVPDVVVYKPSWVREVRFVFKERPVDGKYVEGVNCWSVHAEDVREGMSLFGQWLGPLRLAMHAAIRRLANRKRQKLVHEFTLKLITDDSHLKGWASMLGHFSFMPAYWNVFDVVAARAVLRARMDVAPNEGALRSNMPVVVNQSDGQRRTFARIADRALRACYLCGEINGQPGVFERESLYHMLLECPHESMVRCRVRFKQKVLQLSRSVEALQQSPQELAFDQSELWAVMMLGASWESFPVQLPMPAPLQRPWTQQQVTPAEKAIAEQIRARITVHDRDGIIRAVTWMQPLLYKWTERLRGYHKIGETAAMPGAKLAALVTRHMKIVFATHRRVLEDDYDYSIRARDPLVLDTL